MGLEPRLLRCGRAAGAEDASHQGVNRLVPLGVVADLLPNTTGFLELLCARTLRIGVTMRALTAQHREHIAEAIPGRRLGAPQSLRATSGNCQGNGGRPQARSAEFIFAEQTRVRCTQSYAPSQHIR